MLPARVFDIAKYSFTPADKVLIDTNVLVLIFGINRLADTRIDIYSTAIKDMRDNHSRIYCSGTTLSEFVYVHARRAYEMAKKSSGHKDLKGYLQDPVYFAPLAEDTRKRIESIRSISTMVDSSITGRDFDRLLSDYMQMAIGFNDVIIAAECRQADCCIVSDDIDFARNSKLGISVLTANSQGTPSAT